MLAHRPARYQRLFGERSMAKGRRTYPNALIRYRLDGGGALADGPPRLFAGLIDRDRVDDVGVPPLDVLVKNRDHPGFYGILGRGHGLPQAFLEFAPVQ